MKKRILAAALSALMLLPLLSACTGENPTVPYAGDGCQHVWGLWYDVESVTCLAAGKQIRYCKLCRTPQEQTVEVPLDIAERKHSFSDTVVAPTEAAGGYTTRECILCGHRVERFNPCPALYELVADEATVSTCPAAYSGVLLTDTKTHRLAQHAPTAVHPAFARRLAAALVVTDELAREGAGLSPAATLTVSAELLAGVPQYAATSSNVFYAGAVVTLEQTLGLWLSTGGADAALMLSAFLGITPAAYAAATTARAAALGLTDTEITSIIAPTDFGASTLYDTAVLLCRALDEALLEALLASIAGGAFIKIDGKTPVVWLASANLRMSAIAEGDCVRFLLLAGEGIANGAEADFF